MGERPSSTTMEEQSIDQQKLPGVKEVCRDFAVLEDHSLAHNLQEQEIEHHLASNIQRTRLVQHDLVVAKQLQEEEDLRAQARLKKRHKDLERQDCEIAQEIQEKLVIEADRRRRQEAKDERPDARGLSALYKQIDLDPSHDDSLLHAEPENPRTRCSTQNQRTPERSHSTLDIARLLQEKELKEEKKRKKHLLDPSGIEDGSFHLAAAHSRHSPEEQRSDHDRPRRPRSGESHGRSKEDGKHSQPKVYPEAHEHEWEVSDRSRRHSDDPAERDDRRHRDRDRAQPRRERPERPPAPKLNRDLDVNHRLKELECFDDHVLVRDRCTHQERSPPRTARDAKGHDLKEPSERGHKRGDHLEPKRTAHRARSPSPYRGRDTGHHEESGMRVRGTRDVVHSKPRTEVKELDDAAIARRLQEEELRASQEDERAAQVAQDEEIARLFMEQEKKAHRKMKSCEKASHEKRRPEEWSIEVNELGHPRSRDRHEHHRPRSDKPSRPPPPSSEVIAESEYSRNFDKQPSSTRPFSKSESSPKGSSYRQ